MMAVIVETKCSRISLFIIDLFIDLLTAGHGGDRAQQ
jgi:hypothetical protein